MSRSTQFVGLPQAALEFINQHCSLKRRIIMQENDCAQFEVIKDTYEYIPPESEIYAVTYGIFEEEIPLLRHNINGTWWLEKVQFAEWSSGPVIATMLVSEKDYEEKYALKWSYEEYAKFL